MSFHKTCVLILQIRSKCSLLNSWSLALKNASDYNVPHSALRSRITSICATLSFDSDRLLSWTLLLSVSSRVMTTDLISLLNCSIVGLVLTLNILPTSSIVLKDSARLTFARTLRTAEDALNINLSSADSHTDESDDVSVETRDPWRDWSWRQ